MSERIIGLVLVVSGGLLCYLCIYQPLEEVCSGDAYGFPCRSRERYSPRLFISGAMYLVLGPRATSIMGTREKPTPAAYVIGIGTLIAGFAIYFWLRTTPAKPRLRLSGTILN